MYIIIYNTLALSSHTGTSQVGSRNPTKRRDEKEPNKLVKHVSALIQSLHDSIGCFLVQFISEKGLHYT